MFCRYCGKPLADGEVCDCSQAAAARAAAAARRLAEDRENAAEPAAAKEAPAAQPAGGTEPAGAGPEETCGPAGDQAPPSGPDAENEPAGDRPPTLTLVSTPRRPSKARRFFRNIWQCFRSYFARPVATLETSARIRDWKTGLFWAAVLAVLTGLCGMALIAGSSWLFASSLRTTGQTSVYNGPMMPASGYGQYILAYMLQYIHLRYFVLFLILLVGSLLGYVGMSAVGYAIGAAIHRRPHFRSMLAATGVAAIPSACLTALAAVFSLFWPAVGVFLILAAAVTLLVNSYVAAKAVLGTDDSHLTLYYGLAAAVVLAIVLLIVGRFIPSVVEIAGRQIID